MQGYNDNISEFCLQFGGRRDCDVKKQKNWKKNKTKSNSEVDRCNRHLFGNTVVEQFF